MNHTEIRVVTSAKGGVGKSTVTVGLGAAFARHGKRVLLIDCDTANRSLDLLLGLADSVVFGLSDILLSRCETANAILAVPGLEEQLYLLPSGTADLMLPDHREAFLSLIRSLSFTEDGAVPVSGLCFDHILIDTPGGSKEILLSASAPADEALIISSAAATAVRSAEMTACLLRDFGIGNAMLIINAYMGSAQFYTHTKVRKNRRLQTRAAEELFSVVDSVALPLLGVVPFDTEVWSPSVQSDTEAGCAILTQRSKHDRFIQAFDNIAARCAHHHVPLFSEKI